MSKPAAAISPDPETVEPAVEPTPAPAAPSAPEDAGTSPGTGDEDEDEPAPMPPATGPATETPAETGDAAPVASSANLPGPFRSLIGRVLGLTSGSDATGLRAQLANVQGVLDATKTQLEATARDLVLAKATIAERDAELSAIQKALEQATATATTVEKQALATVASLGIPEDELPRAAGHDSDASQAGTPHLDAFEKLSGPAASAYMQANKTAMLAELARRSATARSN